MYNSPSILYSLTQALALDLLALSSITTVDDDTLNTNEIVLEPELYKRHSDNTIPEQPPLQEQISLYYGALSEVNFTYI